MEIYPRPRKICYTGGFSSLPSKLIFKPNEVSGQLENSFKSLEDSFAMFSFCHRNNDTNFTVRTNCNDIVEQGYRLSFSEGSVSLESSTEAGVFHGLTTLIQIYQFSQEPVKHFEIEDWPDLKNRGYMLDISRCKVPKMESLYSLVDSLALLKFNQFQLYTEHTFAYANHKIVWENSSPLTADEIQKLGTYCQNRYIELVPNQNSFGHLERWLKHDGYKHLAECPDGYEHPIRGWLDHGGTLKPGEDAANFLASLYDELLPNFQSRQINVGCDETWELGQGRSKARAEQVGKHRVYLEFLKRVAQLVNGREKAIQFWGDIVLEEESLVAELPDNATSLVWGYEANHPFEKQVPIFSESGLPFYVAPGTSSWNSVGGRIENAYTNIKSAIHQAIENEAEGCLLTDWGDFGHHQPDSISFPGIIWTGCMCWCFAKNQKRSIESAVGRIFLKEPNPSVAAVLELLGSIPNYFKYSIPNATILNKLLFQNSKDIDSWIHEIPIHELEAARERLQEARSLTEQIRGETSRIETIRADLELASELLDYASLKGIRFLQGKLLTGSEQTAIIEPLIERFEAQWLKRNRTGGLEESVAYLRAPIKS